MRRQTWIILAVVISLLAVSTVAVLRAATIPGDKGDAVLYSEPNTVDVPILKQNGVVVGTVAPIITSVRPNQALSAGTVIQHAALNSRLEIVLISSTGGAVTSTATPRILDGVDGQLIILQGTSASNTYTIPDGAGVKWKTAASQLFTDRSSVMLRFDVALDLWREVAPLTNAEFARSELPPGWGMLMTHATDCPTNTPLGELNDRCIDLDDGREWRCTLASCTTAGNWTLVTPGIVTMQQQATDPAPPSAGFWELYSKSTGVHIRDSAGNITGPLGVGGGGGTSSTDKTAVQAATTGNINLSNPGTAVFDGVTLTTGQRILVWQQSTASQNGIYLFATSSTALTRATDADVSAEFADHFRVNVEGGASYSGVTFYLTNVGAVTLGTTPLTFAVQSWGAKGETTNAKNANSGYLGLRSDGNATHDRVNSYVTHTALSTGSSINPTTFPARMIGIEGSGGAVDLTSNPQIVAGTRADTEIVFVGTHATNTVKLDNGTGIRLCGNTGSLIVGLNGAKPTFRWNSNLSVWEQTNCGDLQQGFDVNNKILTGSTAATGFIRGDFATGNYCTEFWDAANANKPTTRCFCGGVLCPETIFGPIPSGGSVQLLNNVSGVMWKVDEVDGKQHGPGVSVQNACATIWDLTATDDGVPLATLARPITVKSVWCVSQRTTAPTTLPTFTLADGAGNAMAHTAPVCQLRNTAPGTIAASAQAVTGANASLLAFEPVTFNIGVAPSPSTDSYQICFQFSVSD